MNAALKKEIRLLATEHNIKIRFHNGKLTKQSKKNFYDKVDWWFISNFQLLSEGFIREFIDKLNWNYMSAYQKLSEDFIKEFSDKVNWELISSSQELSEKFILEFYDKINFRNLLLFNKRINEETREKIGFLYRTIQS